MDRNPVIVLWVGVVCAAASSASRADILLFDITRDGRDAWADALQSTNKLEHSRFDFGALPDFGMEVMDGPITYQGNSSGSIPPDFLQDAVSLDSNSKPFGFGGPHGRGEGGMGLLGVGSSAGFGNAANALVTNFSEDGFDLSFEDYALITAIEIVVTSFNGSGTIDVTVFSTGERNLGTLTALDAPAQGHVYGLLLIGNSRIGRINLYDSRGGALEGVQGRNILYSGLPSPGGLVLLTVPLVRRSRRRSDVA